MKTRDQDSRRERELLTLCASRLSAGPSNHRISQLLAAGISWGKLLLLADRNGVLPLVYSSLNSFADQVPPPTLQLLKKRTAAMASWNLALASELPVILGHLERNGIAAAAFKGPALAVALYGHLGLRHCRDLDILITAERVWDAVRFLEAEGYQLAAPFPGRPEREWLKTYKDVGLRNAVTGVYVELHWGVCEPAFDPAIHAACLWQRTETVTVLGAPIRFPAPGALLFLLAIHGLRHYWNSLKWIIDVDRWLRKHPGLEWESAAQLADSLGRRRILLLPLQLCRDIFNTPLPAGVSALMRAEADSSRRAN